METSIQNTVAFLPDLSKTQSAWLAAWGILALVLGYHVAYYIYNIYFHPLSKYPGPRLAAASPLWLSSSYFGGKTPTDLLELHKTYGPVVRTSPDGLSYIKAPQWKEIYGHRPGQLEFSKDEKYFSGLKGEPLILNADRHYHGYIRKLFAHGFSEKAMREQELVLKQYVDLMFRRVEEEGRDGTQPVDILKWFNFVTFDFIGFLTYNAGKMSLAQLEGNSQILIAAGSETTATHMSGLVWLLTKNPRALEKLSTEIRTAFSHPDEITFTRVNNCKYLLACIEEGLRVYPPSPQPHHRIVPPGGATVDGEFLPEGVSVSIPIYAASKSPINWVRPDEFIPERWLGEDSEFDSDQRDASQPFQLGPRACIGRNLAYAEIKLIIARLVWQYDVENATEGDWMGDQKVFMVWEKMPLWVKLHPARR
ncbi:hypothetical protein N0V92_001887 [Colletotrichum tropicale]|nr:hypothetical protein N0V92_001887 [Colletotrichum tropicale]